MTESQFLNRKHRYIIDKINAGRFSFGEDSQLNTSGIVSIYLFVLGSAFFNFFLFNFVGWKMGDSMYFQSYVYIFISLICAVISLNISVALRDESFEAVKNHFLFLQFTKDKPLKQSIIINFKRKSHWMYIIMALGVFGATMFVYGVIQSDGITRGDINKRIKEIEERIKVLNENEPLDIAPLQASMSRLAVLGYFSTHPEDGKTVNDFKEEIKIVRESYSAKRDKLDNELSSLRYQRSQIKPESMLSSLADDFGKIFISFVVGLLLSLANDVACVRKIFCEFSVSYSRLSVQIKKEDIYNIYSFENEQNEQEKDSENEQLFVQQMNTLDTDFEQNEQPGKEENHSIVQENLTKDQREVYKEIVKQLNESGRMNISEVSRNVNKVRGTVYKRIDELKEVGLLNGELFSE